MAARCERWPQCPVADRPAADTARTCMISWAACTGYISGRGTPRDKLIGRVSALERVSRRPRSTWARWRYSASRRILPSAGSAGPCLASMRTLS